MRKFKQGDIAYVHPDIADRRKFNRGVTPTINEVMAAMGGDHFTVATEGSNVVRGGGWIWRHEWLLTPEEFDDLSCGTESFAILDIDDMFDM